LAELVAQGYLRSGGNLWVEPEPPSPPVVPPGLDRAAERSLGIAEWPDVHLPHFALAHSLHLRWAHPTAIAFRRYPSRGGLSNSRLAACAILCGCGLRSRVERGRQSPHGSQLRNRATQYGAVAANERMAMVNLCSHRRYLPPVAIPKPLRRGGRKLLLR